MYNNKNKILSPSVDDILTDTRYFFVMSLYTTRVYVITSKDKTSDNYHMFNFLKKKPNNIHPILFYLPDQNFLFLLIFLNIISI